MTLGPGKHSLVYVADPLHTPQLLAKTYMASLQMRQGANQIGDFLVKPPRKARTLRMPKPAAKPNGRARRRVVFTIVSTNYISFAATLMQSVASHMPGVARYIILSDVRREFPDLDLSATLLDCDQLQIEHIDNMKAWYSVIEFNTAVKPFAFLYFFGHLGFDEAYYIDPDILLFDQLTEPCEALRDHSCVLTPHIMHPLQDGKQPCDLTIMRSGIYNLGFLGLRNDDDGRRLAKWWADRCFLHCRVDIAGNMFTDQRWMDLAPAFVARPYILRHPGYNIAYWNLLNREVKKIGPRRWRVNGKPLVFFHFSGIGPDNPSQFSKHQNRYTRENLGVVNEICDLYRSLVLANRWKKYSRLEYGFGSFADGRRIDDVMRHSIARSIDEGRIDPQRTLSFSSDYFDRPALAATEKGVMITRYMYQLWLDRRDLRAAFDIFKPRALQSYFDWFVGGDAAAQGVEAQAIAAAQDLRRAGVVAPQAQSAPTRLPPWPRVSTEVWSKGSAQALSGLALDITLPFPGFTMRVPKQAALLWERRRDLQLAFDLDVPERLWEYLCWALTQGVRDGSIDVTCISAQFVQSFTKISSIYAHYGDVPVTEGMILLRQVSEARDFVPGWQRFPLDRSGRLAHGFWFAFIAPKLFGWPKEFVAPVRNYFLQPTTAGTDGLNLHRAAIAIWELRADMQRMFPLSNRLSTWKYLRWLLIDGLREFGLTIDEFDPRLRAFLLSDSPRMTGVTQLLEMMHDFRPDLTHTFDVESAAQRQALVEWARQHIASETAALPLGEALRDPPATRQSAATAPIHRATIALTGHWGAPSGRGEDLRGSASALDAVGYADYVVVDLASGFARGPGDVVLPAGTRIEADFNIVHTNADSTAEDSATLRRLGVRAQKSIGFWAWELEWLPDYWRYAHSFYDEIWASTRFTEAAFDRDAVRPVKRVPMAVLEPKITLEMSRADLGLPEDATLFVFVFDFRSYAARKNPEAVIRAFLKAFSDRDETVHLLIKTSGASAMPSDASRLRSIATDRRIELRDAVLDRSQILNLIHAADAFVSLHRAEGFGRGPAEAMLLGVPAIVTDYSGTTDYATPDSALLVDYELTAVGETEYPGVMGQRWAEADVTMAARHMRWVHEHRAEARALGLRGRNQIRRLYNTQTVGKALLRALGLRHELRRVERRSDSRN